MKRYEVVVTDAAKDDLRAIRRYFNNVLLSPDTGKQIIQKLKNAIKSLDYMPMRHTVNDSDLADRGIRALPVSNYIIFYIVTHKTVLVIRVIHGSRNWIDLV